MKTMIWIASSLMLMLTACGDASENVESNAKAKTQATAQQSQQSQQTDKVSPRYKSGVNDQNKGDKTGKITLHGKLPSTPGSKLYLYQTEARTKALVDSATIIKGGTYSFKNVEVSRGFYELNLNGEANNKCQIILNPDEKDVNIDFRTSRLNGTKTSVNSKENQGLIKYLIQETKNKNEIKQLRKGMKDSPYRKRIEQQIKDKELELVQVQHAMIDEYAGTYLAKFLGWKNSKYPNSQGRYFEDMDPLDNSLIHSMAISDRIQGMMVKFSKGEDARFLACIDIIKAHFEPNPATLESALYAMLDGFYNTGKEDICLYILDN